MSTNISSHPQYDKKCHIIFNVSFLEGTNVPQPILCGVYVYLATPEGFAYTEQDDSLL